MSHALEKMSSTTSGVSIVLSGTLQDWPVIKFFFADLYYEVEDDKDHSRLLSLAVQ